MDFQILIHLIESLPALAMDPGADYLEHWTVLRDNLRMVLR